MVNKASSVHSTTTSTSTTTRSTLRLVLNNTASNTPVAARMTCRNQEEGVLTVYSQCLQELGFAITVKKDNYNNQIVFNDYSDNIECQMFNTSATTTMCTFLYPTVVGATSSWMGNNSSSACSIGARMIGAGPGETKTGLFFNRGSVPELSGTAGMYFTEARFLPTGEMKKAIILQNSTSYSVSYYDLDWSFLPGYDNALKAKQETNTYWGRLSLGSKSDPYVMSYLRQRQNEFPIVPAISADGLWEFPDVAIIPFGLASDSATSESMLYSLAAGNVYQFGDKKFLCNLANANSVLLRVE